MKALIVSDDSKRDWYIKNAVTKHFPLQPRVLISTNDREAAEMIIWNNVFDFIFVDGRVSGVNTGVELIERAREIESEQERPAAQIIYLSSVSDEKEGQEAYRAKEAGAQYRFLYTSYELPNKLSLVLESLATQDTKVMAE